MAAIEANDDMRFVPAEVEVKPGEEVTVTNAGRMFHDLTCDSLSIHTARMKHGESEIFTIPATADAGETHEFYCSMPGHKQMGMVGTFKIVAA